MIDTKKIFADCGKLFQERNRSLLLQQLDEILIQIPQLYFIVENSLLRIDLRSKSQIIASQTFAKSSLFVQNIKKIFNLRNNNPEVHQYRFLQLRDCAIIHCTYHFSTFKITLTQVKPQTSRSLAQLGINNATITAIKKTVSTSKMILVTAPREGGATTTQGAVLEIVSGKCCAIDYANSKWPQNTELIPIKLEVGRNCSALLRSLESNCYQAIAHSIRDNFALQNSINLHHQGKNIIASIWGGMRSPLHIIKRLGDLGFPKDLDGLGLVITQHLVPKMCEHCLQPYRPPKQLKKQLAKQKRNHNSVYYFANGCERCERNNYHDQVLIYESWTICDEFRSAFLANACDDTLTKIAKKTATFDKVAWELLQKKQLHLDLFLQIARNGSFFS
ncbi:hypothetical protein [Candidatus Uabimicrobium sp. HlEnr_7]|uniref:ATPase, T2SS/T4P/T4SS family n=1 Tax=Candidatus Uabimicrobium helgolandensis TaxID=3095367 RepID=UPI0035562139